HRVARGRSRNGRRARSHDPLVRHHPCPRRTARAHRNRRRLRAAALAIVGRGLRRGRGGRVERAHARRRRPTRYVPRTRDARRSRAQEVDLMPATPVPTPSAPPVAGPYSPAVRAGDWLILAGQVGFDPATETMANGIEAQTRQVFENITAILIDCGAAITD